MDILISYGALSGLSEAAFLEALPLEPLPILVNCTKDFDGSLKSKVSWITKMVFWLSLFFRFYIICNMAPICHLVFFFFLQHNLLHDDVYPVIEKAIDNASS